ncbi:poly(A) RNA polymerase, mitochondrial-like isoform X2 [Contarinia nasturtii]|uniref:poly(A) RNA polymerase, mitochondrial-like isoform X2 n=1 Tax=Contarinia nasturtii TaxID=265458 RepID=UPI0012D4A10C|nr:poly(A) RNA polymerase, mitochondrial-like isoform X2 [Contarinia nasturtii]
MLKLRSCLKSSQYINGIFQRWHSTVLPSQKLNESCLNKENLEDLMARRQSEALRSIVVEVNKKDVCGQVYNHCKQFGEIKNAFVHTLNDARTLMLLEYEDADAVNETFKFSGFKANTVQWPNRFLALRNSKLNPLLSADAPLQITNKDGPSITHILRNATTFDEQVRLLYQHTQLTDFSVRLKFLTALQAQIVTNEYLDDIFPNAKVYPFGSSVNGFGKMGCDLDMVLHFKKNIDSIDENSDMPLAFQGNQCESAEEIRKLAGCQVRCLASMIDYLVPGTDVVTPIGNARVPIVRYNDTNIDNSVDLSVNNIFHITEFMFAMGLMDQRIRPLVYMVRQWYKNFEMDRYIGRENFTNFQLSYMCLSFLQQLKEPLIPTYDEMMNQITAHESDNVVANILKKPFIFNFDHFHFETKNTSTVLELFIQFLVFVETFDFSKHMVTLRTTAKIMKPEPEPASEQQENQPQTPKKIMPLTCYMDNIFNSENAWGGNISDPEVSTIKIMSKKTLTILEECTAKSSGKDWGILQIIKTLK